MSRYFTDDHEWIDVDGDIATIGITDFAQGQLGDIVFIELPDVGASYSKGDEAAVVESVKAASEIYAPIDGEVVEVNEALEDEPAQVNKDAEGGAWFVKLKVADAGQLGELMSLEQYKAHVAEQG